jgi:sulfite oxidase
VNSAILSPDDGARVPAGPTTVRGYALAGGDREIARVEVSADAGAHWARADLGEQHSRWSWRLWSTTLDLAPGRATVVARAWDTSATVQPESAAQLWNPGGYANNAWARVDLTAL